VGGYDRVNVDWTQIRINHLEVKEDSHFEDVNMLLYVSRGTRCGGGEFMGGMKKFKTSRHGRSPQNKEEGKITSLPCA